MEITDTELRLLRVFKAVADAGGFSNAQVALSLNPSTISAKMSALESQLGYTLCTRGRAGFRLTDEGAALYRQVVELFRSIQSFQAQSSELRGSLGGRLRIGFLDNVIGDPDSPLREAIGRFVRKSRQRVRLSVEVFGPRELEQALLDEAIDVAVGIFFDELPSLTYRPLYRERDVLVCHPSHALARLPHGEQARSIPDAAKVVRTFMGEREFPFNKADVGPGTATVTNVEAAAMLILTGQYIGFLPHHYARPWLEGGELVVLLPGRAERHSQFSLVTRRQPGATSSALQAFLSCTREVTQAMARSSPPGADAPAWCEGADASTRADVNVAAR